MDTCVLAKAQTTQRQASAYAKPHSPK